MEESRFAYTINPRIPLHNFAGERTIRTSTTLKLTKEEALEAMKKGPVLRRFANEGFNERVTSLNIDRLHREKYMSEAEYKAFLQENVVDEKPSIPVETIPIPNATEPPVTVNPVMTEENKAETVPAVDVEEDVVKENLSNTNVNENAAIEAVEVADTTKDMEENAEQIVSEETSVEDEKENSNPQVSVESSDTKNDNGNKSHQHVTVNYSGKNKHRRNK